jgi:hypothetical protein
MLSRVFDLFAQADRALDRSQGGLGIGLTVARRLAEMHGGTVTADSPGLGRGSTFTIRLPLSQPANDDGPPTDPVADSALAGIRVLVVDDNHDTATSAAMLLRAYGHDVRPVFDGPAALELAHAFQPHVILLDIGLPGMNGYEVAQSLVTRFRGDYHAISVRAGRDRERLS